MSTPDVVSKRNHFTDVHDMVLDFWQRLPVEQRTELLLGQLEYFTIRLIHSVANDFATGADRGIEQTAKLLVDPEYYETLKTRRQRERERQEQYALTEHQEQLERTLAPTAIQIEQEEANLIRWISDAEASLVRYRERLQYLSTLKNRPKHVRISDRRPK
jgi:FMN phosphatase YigB (HAD superfamily)